MKVMKNVVRALTGILLVIILADLIQYILLFPYKKYIVIFVFGGASLVLLSTSIFLLKESKKVYLYIFLASIVFAFTGVQKRTFANNELLMSVNSSKVILDELRSLLSEYVKREQNCPESWQDLLGNNNGLLNSVKYNYQIQSSNSDCYVLLTHIGNGGTSKLKLPSEANTLFMKESYIWSFYLNDLIYIVSGYDEKALNFGISVSHLNL